MYGISFNIFLKIAGGSPKSNIKKIIDLLKITEGILKGPNGIKRIDR